VTYTTVSFSQTRSPRYFEGACAYMTRTRRRIRRRYRSELTLSPPLTTDVTRHAADLIFGEGQAILAGWFTQVRVNRFRQHTLR